MTKRKSLRDYSQTFLLRNPMITDNSQTILKLRTGQEIILPQRKDLLGGLKFTRRFSHNEVHPYDEVDWTRRDVRIMDWKPARPFTSAWVWKLRPTGMTTPSKSRRTSTFSAVNPAPWNMKTASAISTTAFPIPIPYGDGRKATSPRWRTRKFSMRKSRPCWCSRYGRPTPPSGSTSATGSSGAGDARTLGKTIQATATRPTIPKGPRTI